MATSLHREDKNNILGFLRTKIPFVFIDICYVINKSASSEKFGPAYTKMPDNGDAVYNLLQTFFFLRSIVRTS